MGRICNIGIIGLGRWGMNYLRTFNGMNNVQVKAICDRDENAIRDKLDKLKTRFKVKTTTNYKEILEDKDIDAVSIISPGTTHYNLTKESLQNDKHVMVEKPLAFNSKDAEELIKISNAKRKMLMVGHLHLFNPGIQKIKEDIDAGLFGKINYIHSIGAGNGPVRQDMSALWDYFPHDVSILLYLLDKLPLSVSVKGASYLKKGIEDVVVMEIKFPNNVFASAFGSWLYPIKRRDLIVVGEKLYSSFEDYAPDEKLKYYPGRPKFEQGKIIIGEGYTAQKINDSKPLAEQLKHFLYCIENDKDPLTGADEALNVVKVLECAQKSLENNGLWVEVK